MSEVATLPKTNSREDILAFEKMCKNTVGFISGDLAKKDNEWATYLHTFAEGVYIRQMFLKQGALLSGEIQKYDHAVFLMNGVIEIAVEDGTAIIEAPCHFVAKAGTKRIGRALTDVVWCNIHPNPTNTQDLKEIEENIICKTFEDFDMIEKYNELIKINT